MKNILLLLLVLLMISCTKTNNESIKSNDDNEYGAFYNTAIHVSYVDKNGVDLLKSSLSNSKNINFNYKNFDILYPIDGKLVSLIDMRSDWNWISAEYNVVGRLNRESEPYTFGFEITPTAEARKRYLATNDRISGTTLVYLKLNNTDMDTVEVTWVSAPQDGAFYNMPNYKYNGKICRNDLAIIQK